jgi:UDP-N-acetyl-D-mannosaminuronic acid dehydrogenase
MAFDLCVIGGCGHVGLPLAIAFAVRGKRVAIYDIDRAASDGLRQGELLFIEQDGAPMLREALASGNLFVADGPEVISQSDAIVLVLATPIDGHMSPSF